MRVNHHPYWNQENRREITFRFNGLELKGLDGDTVASALWANNIKGIRTTEKLNLSRGMYCGIGHCYDCRVNQDGFGMVRACITPIKDAQSYSSK